MAPRARRYYEAFLDGNWLCIIMEFAQAGDLSHYIKKGKERNSPFPEEVVWSFFIQILRVRSPLPAPTHTLPYPAQLHLRSEICARTCTRTSSSRDNVHHGAKPPDFRVRAGCVTQQRNRVSAARALVQPTHAVGAASHKLDRSVTSQRARPTGRGPHALEAHCVPRQRHRAHTACAPAYPARAPWMA